LRQHNRLDPLRGEGPPAPSPHRPGCRRGTFEDLKVVGVWPPVAKAAEIIDRFLRQIDSNRLALSLEPPSDSATGRQSRRAVRRNLPFASRLMAAL
jgi:hypothetical protein